MPFVRVAVDRDVVVSIDTEGREHLAVLVGGSRVNNDAGHISVIGGRYSGDDPDQRIWLKQPLLVGQVVRVELLWEADAIGEGKTSEQLYPQLSADRASPPLSRAEMASQFE